MLKHTLLTETLTAVQDDEGSVMLDQFKRNYDDPIHAVMTLDREEQEELFHYLKKKLSKPCNPEDRWLTHNDIGE